MTRRQQCKGSDDTSVIVYEFVNVCGCGCVKYDDEADGKSENLFLFTRSRRIKCKR